MKKVFLELGGKSACIVLDDADIARRWPAARSRSPRHAGQGCAITSRLLLPREPLRGGLEARRELRPGALRRPGGPER